MIGFEQFFPPKLASRLVSTVAVPKPKLKTYPKAKGKLDKALKGQRQVYFGRDTGSMPCSKFARERLQPGLRLSGPAIVEQMDSTTVIYPGQTAVIDSYRNIIISALES